MIEQYWPLKKSRCVAAASFESPSSLSWLHDHVDRRLRANVNKPRGRKEYSIIEGRHADAGTWALTDEKSRFFRFSFVSRLQFGHMYAKERRRT